MAIYSHAYGQHSMNLELLITGKKSRHKVRRETGGKGTRELEEGSRGRVLSIYVI